MIRGKRNPVVRVIAYRKSADAPIQLAVTPELLDMYEFAKGGQTITWRLDTKGYQFPTDGLAIEFTSPGWEKAFTDFKVHDCGRRVTAYNRNRGGLAYAYNVHVIEQSTGTRAFLDPTVGNRET